jgi:hypothetical protein
MIGPESAREPRRSLPLHEWPDADRRAWEDACRPSSRLKPDGAASYLAQVSRDAVWRILGVLAADRSARARCGGGGPGHIAQRRGLSRRPHGPGALGDGL